MKNEWENLYVCRFPSWWYCLLLLRGTLDGWHFWPTDGDKRREEKTRKLIINERLFILSETNWHVRAGKNLKGIMKWIIIKHNVTEVINYKQFSFLCLRTWGHKFISFFGAFWDEILFPLLLAILMRTSILNLIKKLHFYVEMSLSV